MEKKTEIAVDLRNSVVFVKGEGDGLIKLVQELKGLAPGLEIRILPVSQPLYPEIQPSMATTPHETRPAISHYKGSLKDFTKSLTLTNFYEKIAAIGFYFIKIEGKPFFSTQETGDAFLLCGFEKPSQISTAFSDCKRKYGYIKSLERGRWTITPSAENLVLRRQGKGGG